MRRWLKITLLFWILLSAGFANQMPERQFDTLRLEAYKNDPAFDYTGERAQSGSPVAMVLAWLSERLAPLLETMAIHGITPVFFRILLLAGIALAVYLIVRIRFGAVLEKRTKSLDGAMLSYPAGEKEDYEKLLRETLQGKQFKLAVRYLFLTALGTLQQQRKIKITQWKAPYEYLKELPCEQRMAFRQITDLFESTWYGDYMPDGQALAQGLEWYDQLENA